MPLIRSQRRSLALVAGALLCVAPLSACGFNYSTDEVYTASAGVDDRTGTLDILSAVVVSEQKGSGTFIASFSNNSEDTSERVLAMSAGTDNPTLKVAGFTPITVKPAALVNLATDPSITLTGEFSAGDYVSLKFDLENEPDLQISIPVVAATYQYEGLDISEPTSPTE